MEDEDKQIEINEKIEFDTKIKFFKEATVLDKEINSLKDKFNTFKKDLLNLLIKKDLLEDKIILFQNSEYDKYENKYQYNIVEIDFDEIIENNNIESFRNDFFIDLDSEIYSKYYNDKENK